jgi:dihydrofolate reductase
MSKLRVAAFSISLDGYGAGPDQRLEHPLGENGTELHQWFFDTTTFRKMHGGEGGRDGVDEEFAARGFRNVGAWILGRNMFGPVRGPWPDASWRGWWGDSPPYHVPVFVLTHHARPPLEMQGGTTFHFITDGIGAALERARESAGALDVRLGGGVSTIRQFLRERLIDELHLAISPVLLGRGEALFQGMDWRTLGYRCVETVAGEKATHVVLAKQA